MYTVYALHSPSYEKIYIGFTSDLENRMLSHNKLGTKGWTINYRPWEVVYTEEHETKSEAMKREKELKTAQGRQFIWRKHESGEMGAHIWAPELHHTNGKWYRYFAAGAAEDIWAIRMDVLENDSENPMKGSG